MLYAIVGFLFIVFSIFLTISMNLLGFWLALRIFLIPTIQWRVEYTIAFLAILVLDIIFGSAFYKMQEK